jgi:DNA-binding MarR family transcriptional regulator
MIEETPWYETIIMPALLRHARSAYGAAMRRALAEAGFDDVPKNGMYVIGGLALGAGDAPLSVLIDELGVSKQAAGQLIDTLVLRGYLSRETNEDDRRRLVVTLTERGRTAAQAQAVAREKIDAQLLAKMGRENLSRTRKTLAALCGIAKAERVAH